MKYLVSDARISVFGFILRDVEAVLGGDVLPELGRTLARKLADPASKFARTSRPLFVSNPKIYFFIFEAVFVTFIFSSYF